MKVGPNVMTHSQGSQDRDVVPRVRSSTQAGGNLKLIQCQLMLLLHARKCQNRLEVMLTRKSGEQQQNVSNMARALLLNCPVRHCFAMKNVLNHLRTCSKGESCTFKHCTTSLRILSHWSQCTVPTCDLCQCVRQRNQRLKEWQATTSRKYTLLAAALRSSQVPLIQFPNCNAAENAGEGESGIPLRSQEELKQQRPNTSGNFSSLQHHPQGGGRESTSPPPQNRGASPACDKPSDDDDDKTKPDGKTNAPTLDQVRKAYEQLGIPCPPENLKRLMATLRSKSQGGGRMIEMDNESSTDSDSGGDLGVYDCSSSELSPSSVDSEPERNTTQPGPSTSNHFRFQEQQQHPVVSSTTVSTTSHRNSHKSSSRTK